MQLDFYFFRHGQTDYNVQGVWQGSGTNAVLNATGERQAYELASKFIVFGFTRLYCSPMLRAVQTADAISRYNSNMPITILQDLRECSFGECEGVTSEEVLAKFGREAVDEFLYPTKDNWDMRFPGGESKHEVFARVYNCLNGILASLSKDEHHCIGIVCHAGVLSALQCGFDLKDVSYDNCAVWHLSYNTDTREWTQVFD